MIFKMLDLLFTHMHATNTKKNIKTTILTRSTCLMQIAPEFNPKSNGEWSPDYHGMLYNLTDDAIQGTTTNQ